VANVLSEFLVPVLVAVVLGLAGWVWRMGRALSRVVAAVRGEPADPVTGDAGRPPIAQQVGELRAGQAAMHLEQTAMRSVQDEHTGRLARIEAEMRPNHGSSMRDRVDAALDGIRRIEARLPGGTP
jgi:hypothetical protein